ncbi:hypothetical protein [Pseudanabaena minima]|uniref:hypothetical protein n=1 Tax=Pseudanabaena minima TaxID=890415 RepID=UPI003DA8B95F
MSFASKLRTAIAANQSILCLGLDPNPEVMPAKYKAKYDSEMKSGAYPDHAVIPKHKEEATDDIREKGERG